MLVRQAAQSSGWYGNPLSLKSEERSRTHRHVPNKQTAEELRGGPGLGERAQRICADPALDPAPFWERESGWREWRPAATASGRPGQDVGANSAGCPGAPTTLCSRLQSCACAQSSLSLLRFMLLLCTRLISFDRRATPIHRKTKTRSSAGTRCSLSFEASS